MNLADLPSGAFDVHLKAGCVVHFKQRVIVKATSKHECLQKIRALKNGRLESLPAQVGEVWQATFIQAMSFDPPKKEDKPN